MNIVKNITVNLSEDDVKEIIADYIRNKMRYENVTVKDVSINVGWKSSGYFMDDHDVPGFKNVTVNCKLEE